jgi:hypothetical protein
MDPPALPRRMIRGGDGSLCIKPINSESGFEQEEPLINKTDYVPAGCKPKDTP